MILFENALEIFEKRKIKNPHINIEITQQNKNILILIKDNGGGITIEPIEDIFNMFISSKVKSSGIGLAMCKILIENRLDGKIKVFNNQHGACFEILLC